MKRIRIYELDAKGEDISGSYQGMYGYPASLGEVTRSRENGAFMEFSVTFTQFSTLHFYSAT